MSHAFLCDGCQEPQTGQPIFHMDPALFVEYSWPQEGWDFCALSCIQLWLDRMRDQIKEQA